MTRSTSYVKGIVYGLLKKYTQLFLFKGAEFVTLGPSHFCAGIFMSGPCYTTHLHSVDDGGAVERNGRGKKSVFARGALGPFNNGSVFR